MVSTSALLVSLTVVVVFGSAKDTTQSACTDCDGSEDSVLLQTISSHNQSRDDRGLAGGVARWAPPPTASCYQGITTAQAAWGDAIVSISNAYLQGRDYVGRAKRAIRQLYSYNIAALPVMFKPTLAAEHPFRSTFEGALSYFVGYEAIKPQGFKEDKGFAINGGDGWSKVAFDNDEISCVGDFLFTHGYYYFTNAKTGAVTGVECSFGYKRMTDGSSKIFIHTSTLPFQPASEIQTEVAGLLEEAKDLNKESDKECCEAIRATQKEWGDAILRISSSFPNGDHVLVAEDAIEELYGYDVGPVLFKPTKAEKDPFRPTSIGALSYFVGYEALKPTGFSEDTGFAINGGDGWSKVRFDNDQIFCMDGLAFAQGYYYFTDAKSQAEVGVEYTFVYRQMENDKLKIMLHHSSLPYVPGA